MSDENVLKKFLSSAGISDDLAKKIDTNLNGSLEEFFANSRKWSEYGLNEPEIIRILGYMRKFDITPDDDLPDYEQHQFVDQKFYENHREEIKKLINDVSEKNKKTEIEKQSNEHFKKHLNKLALAGAVSTVTATTLAFLGNRLVPGLGIIVGSFFGFLGIFGMGYYQKSRIEKEIIRKLENGEAVELNENLSEKLYEYALDTLNVPRNSNSQRIKELRVVYRLANHPDKNIEMKDEKTRKNNQTGGVF